MRNGDQKVAAEASLAMPPERPPDSLGRPLNTKRRPEGRRFVRRVDLAFVHRSR
jgi:hypothetical protein